MPPTPRTPAIPPSTEPAPEPSVRPGRSSLSEVLRPAWSEVNLSALVANFRRLRDLVRPAQVLAVIKADGYGHGAPDVARALETAGVDLLGVALLEEGAEVRRAGVRTPILVLGVPRRAQLPYFRRYRLTPVVSGMDQLLLWRDWLEEGPATDVQAIHLQVDTGMTRLGIDEADLQRALEIIRGCPRLELAGLLSHFADADVLDSERNPDQERRFARAVESLTPEERSRATLHLANSAGALHWPASRHDLVRLGLALYGYDPAGRLAGLEPVMSVKTRTVLVREIAPGTRVSYGGRWTARRPSRIAVLPVGYADGYSWRLTGKAEALVRGRRVPVVGAVSMDMSFVDLTDLAAAGEEVGVDEEVVLLGRQGEGLITAPELAAAAGTIPWELLCLLGLRLPRRYVNGDDEGETRSRFEGGLP